SFSLFALSVAGHFLSGTGNVIIQDVHQGLRKQLMEEACSYDQGYIMWNPPPYQHHAPRYNAYQSNGYGDAYYGYEDPSPPHPPSKNVVECLNHDEVHECLGDAEVENKDQEAEDVDQEVEDKDKELKGMKIVHSASFEATIPKLPSELHFEWVNFSNLNFIGPQHYALLETDDQLRTLCGVLDKKEMDSLGLDESRFITCEKSEFKSYSGHLLHNNRAKVGAFSLRKHLGAWQFQEKLVDSHSNRWTNQVWDPGKSYENQNFWGIITRIGAFRDLLNMNWDPTENTKFKHWWRFKDEFKHKPP
ncbi:hypothetical protein PIB30_067173, partial [Stylosanthes scabra]|nr:hypothetical protein [Stylosanthes scabra]